MNSILCIMLAATTVLRLELENETPYIVGVDGVRRQVCIVDPAEYAMMTGRVDQVWRTMNATESGRVGLHGARVTQEVDETSCVKTTVYKDGYRFAEPMPKKHITVPDAPSRRGVPKPEAVNRRISDRQRRFREAIEARKSAPIKEITVEHDAATGKDKVVK